MHTINSLGFWWKVANSLQFGCLAPMGRFGYYSNRVKIPRRTWSVRVEGAWFPYPSAQVYRDILIIFPFGGVLTRGDFERGWLFLHVGRFFNLEWTSKDSRNWTNFSWFVCLSFVFVSRFVNFVTLRSIVYSTHKKIQIILLGLKHSFQQIILLSIPRRHGPLYLGRW